MTTPGTSSAFALPDQLAAKADPTLIAAEPFFAATHAHPLGLASSVPRVRSWR